MRTAAYLWLALALLAPAAAHAQPTPPAPPAAPSDFSGLWTSWDGASRAAMARESEALAQLRRDIATADARRLSALHAQGRSLGERVGEIVRGGDCEEGERVARDAGDFALVAAVRAHCREGEAPATGR
jgi:hypothetical protein